MTGLAHQTGPAVGLLRQRGWEIFEAPRAQVEFTKQPGADALLNDLGGYPHAFVLACVCDRQDSAERVWRIPYLLGQRLGSVAFGDLAACSQDEIAMAMTVPDALHRFPAKMSEVVFRALQRIRDEYDGDASRLWTGSPAAPHSSSASSASTGPA